MIQMTRYRCYSVISGQFSQDLYIRSDSLTHRKPRRTGVKLKTDIR